MSSLVAEFVGTFLLVFTVGCCSIVGDALWNATAIGCVLMVSIYSVGAVSGGHLNPAVSVALGLSGKEPFPKVILYLIAQVLGGLLAGVAYCSVFNQSVRLSPKAPFSWWDAILVEVLYTSMLCFVVLNCAASKRNNLDNDGNNFFALAIGFVIIAGGYGVGNVSGAAFNPAVSLGLDITSWEDGVFWGPIYALFQVLGAAVASILFFACRPEDFKYPPLNDYDLDSYVAPLGTRLLSEFLGTFILVFTVGMNIISKSPATAWSAAAALMCMIYSLGNVSGAHFNPAVTLAVVLSGRDKCEPIQGAMYVAVQIAAGLLAGCAYSHYHWKGEFNQESFGLVAKGSYSNWEVFGAEGAFTFMLAFVVLACATTRLPPSVSQGNFYFALAIGSCVTAGGFASGAISGGSLNPAVSVGIATETYVWGGNTPDTVFWTNCLYYGLFELAGGALAALIFSITHHKEYEPSEKHSML